jgi:hypothetical protein
MLRSHGGGYAEDPASAVSPLYAPSGREGDAYEAYGRDPRAPPPRSRRESASSARFDERGAMPRRSRGSSVAAVEGYPEDERDADRERTRRRRSREGRGEDGSHWSQQDGRSDEAASERERRKERERMDHREDREKRKEKEARSRRASTKSDERRPTFGDSIYAAASGLKKFAGEVNKRL